VAKFWGGGKGGRERDRKNRFPIQYESRHFNTKADYICSDVQIFRCSDVQMFSTVPTLYPVILF
jgi:hypothetical protein